MTPGRRVLRAPNHLGDVIMALPAVAADGADVMVVRWLAPVLEMAGLGGRVLPLDRGIGGWRRAVAELRRTGYERGVLLTPAFSAAWLFRWGGVRHLRGTATDGRTWLLADGLPREALGGRHRINQYKLLLGQDPDTEALNHPLAPPQALVDAWRTRLGVGRHPVVGVFPGSNAPARRWAPERFGDVAAALTADGARCVVLGGSGEKELTARVAARAPGAVDAGGETDLPGLAAALSVCDVVVTNDTGPMHLAGAVGTPTITLWGPSDPEEVRPVGARNREVHGPDLPCRPCFKNHCPRSGVGTLLERAHEECMNLITVDQVTTEARRLVETGPT
ncbi:MAG: glycosyltransferase family 9 protein [Longimicrobiales bacterium]